jgi:hypothetical protein
MKRTITSIILIFILVMVFIGLLNTEEEYYNLKLEKLKQEYAIKPVPSVNHSCSAAAARVCHSAGSYRNMYWLPHRKA